MVWMFLMTEAILAISQRECNNKETQVIPYFKNSFSLGAPYHCSSDNRYRFYRSYCKQEQTK
ncbi:hypothetical protein NQ314_009311 [Rhamnusium bicolor]|uniref:Uncharacterized protein n=1 Tax=Rhamnusium bicolor TaxID=1586634 RepID=A0AAV8Y1A5_9CUCU|nr:hypothetical protein NQ314_009311 [Rhamnusium bicolor]